MQNDYVLYCVVSYFYNGHFVLLCTIYINVHLILTFY